jgi:hypothetical protein
LIRDTARQQIEEFVRGWLLQSFPDAENVRIEVIFSDESPLARSRTTLETAD